MIHKIFELAAAAAAKDVFRLHAATIIQPTLHNLLQNPLSVFGNVHRAKKMCQTEPV